ncbi:MAG: hypothetical protein ABW352_04685 [Polyangiales bacterium]
MTLAFGYASLIAGPLWNARGALGSLGELASGLPQPLTIGIVLLGAAALIFVVARLVRDVDVHPYASIAPVLAVFSGLVLASIRADLPFPTVGGPQLGLAGLTLALVGGALVGRAELGARMLGWALAALPTFALMLALTAARGDGDPVTMFRAVDAPLRAYVALLAVSSLALGLVGQFAHFLARKQGPASAPMLRLAPSAPTPLGLRAPEHVLRPPPMRQTMPGMPRHDSPAAFAAAYVPGSYAQAPYAYAQPSMPALSMDDPDLLALTRKGPLAQLAWLAAGTLALAAVAGYFMVIKPERDRELALQRVRSLQAAQARTNEAAQPQDALADRMSRYLAERQQERAAEVAATAPVVTPLAPTPTVAPAPAAPVQALAAQVQEEPKAERRHHRRHHARREQAKPELAKPAPKVEKAEPKPAPKVEAKPAKPNPNERELDLDDLLKSSLKGGGKNSGADDPILGL